MPARAAIRQVRTITASLALCALACVSPARAEDWAQSPTLTGNWGGAREALRERGVNLSLDYTLDMIGNVAGGLARGFTPIGNADLVLEADLERLLHWRGASLRVYAIGNHARSLSARAGDLQIADNIEAASAFRLFEAWLQQSLGTPKVTLRGGHYDINTEFDVVPSAALFVHSSPGMGAAFGNAGSNGPSSFPVTSLAARLDVRPHPKVYLRAVVAEGIPGDPRQPQRTRARIQADEGALLAAEVGVYRLPGEVVDSRQRRFRDPFVGDIGAGEGWFGKYALGVWGITGQVQPFWDVGQPETRVRGSYGGYLLATQRIYHEPAAASQGLAVYLRPGLADRRVALFDAYLGAGAVYRGALPGRPFDRLGLQMSAAHFGPRYLGDLAASGTRTAAWEVALELTYRARVLGWWMLQPDLQLVVNPGGRASPAPALIVGLRSLWSL